MARISEIHYSNSDANNTGVGEFFEVALAPGENPADFFVSTYTPEVLASANALRSHAGVTRCPRACVRYYHMLFERHEIVFANGMASESFFPGPSAMSSLEEHAQTELLELFPELRRGHTTYGQPARPVLKRLEAEVLIGSGV